MDTTQPTVSSEHMKLAEAIIGKTWVPIGLQRRRLALRIAEAMAAADVRVQAAERELDSARDAAERKSKRKD